MRRRFGLSARLAFSAAPNAVPQNWIVLGFRKKSRYRPRRRGQALIFGGLESPPVYTSAVDAVS